MSAPRFSVICPAYRATATLATTVESVLRQSFADLEMIIVDDGSGDGTPDIADRFAERDPRVRVIRQENSGTASARNTGIDAASGRLVSLIDNDDVWLPDYLQAVDAAFRSSPRAGLGFAEAWTYSERLNRVHSLTTLSDLPPVADVLSGEQLTLALLRVNFVTASAATASREALEAAGTFEPTLSGSDDWDMWLRIGACGFGAVRVGRSPLVVLRDSEAQQSRDQLKMLSTAERTAVRARERAPEGSRERLAAQAYVDSLQPHLRRLRSPSPAARLVTRLRGGAIAAKNRVVARRMWRPPPGEVTAVMRP